MPHDTVPLRVRVFYSFGHFQNDLMASMWFSYLLIYLHQVQHFNNIYAGTLLLVGQIADAIATPLIGYEADITSGCCRYTKRKSWHVFGLVCTTFSFPFIFAPVIGAGPHTADWNMFIYYASFVVIFQIGWASVQISHLSLIPQLTSDPSEVAGLNGWRYAATGVANLSTYALAWVILSSGGQGVDPDKLTKADADHFMNLGLIVTGLGVIASIFFHMFVPEPQSNSRKLLVETSGEIDRGYGTINSSEPVTNVKPVEEPSVDRSSRRQLCAWFKDARFYQVAVIYMCTRLYVNISQVYLPMYLTETVKLQKVTIANVPLVCYASSFVTAACMKKIHKCCGRKLTYFVGGVFAIGTCVFLYFIPVHTRWMVFVAAGMIGIGGAFMLITSLSLVADLIGEFTGSSAFVYGAMSFTDKLFNGLAIEVIQLFHPCVNCCPACQPYYRHVQSYVPGGAAIVALIGLSTLALSCARRRSRVERTNSASSESSRISQGCDSESPRRDSASNAFLASSDHSVERDTYYPPVSQTVVDISPRLAGSVNSAAVSGESGNDADNEDSPLLRNKGSGINS